MQRVVLMSGPCGMLPIVTPAELRDLKTEYVFLAAYYQQRIDDGALNLYASDLNDLALGEVLDAMSRLRRQPGRRTYPLPSDIREAVAPQEGSLLSQANDIAGRISAAIGRYGYTQADRAKSFVGDLGWLVICRMGGWRSLCNSLLSADMGTFRAQCRDLARAQLEMEASGARRGTAPGLSGRRKSAGRELTSASDVIAMMPALARAPCRSGALGPK